MHNTTRSPSTTTPPSFAGLKRLLAPGGSLSTSSTDGRFSKSSQGVSRDSNCSRYGARPTRCVSSVSPDNSGDKYKDISVNYVQLRSLIKLQMYTPMVRNYLKIVLGLRYDCIV